MVINPAPVPATIVVSGPQKQLRYGAIMLNSAVFLNQTISISEEHVLLFASSQEVVDGNLASGRWRR